MLSAGAEAATDVTGFGLLGHLHEMLLASGVARPLDAGAVPFIPGSVPLARDGIVAGGTHRNLEFVDPARRWGELDEPERLLLADAQTSGGLLIATIALSRELDARRCPRTSSVGVTRPSGSITARAAPGRVTVTGRVGE